MKETFAILKDLLPGKWTGEGFAKFPTIDDTAYTENLEFIPDEFKDAIFFQQKTFYKNNTAKNGHTVFWDCGFIILREEKIVLHSMQVGGRIETFDLTGVNNNSFTFDSTSILVDPKATRSQRIFTIQDNTLHYELNMATRAVPAFQNHLQAALQKLQ